LELTERGTVLWKWLRYREHEQVDAKDSYLKERLSTAFVHVLENMSKFKDFRVFKI
jgi:hypothetical protein